MLGTQESKQRNQERVSIEMLVAPGIKNISKKTNCASGCFPCATIDMVQDKYYLDDSAEWLQV